MTNNTEFTPSRCSTPARRGGSCGPIQTCTVLYKFVAQNSRYILISFQVLELFKRLSSRELSLNRGDVVRIHREIDSNWFEGERNGHIGIFPSSYVQVSNMILQTDYFGKLPYFRWTKIHQRAGTKSEYFIHSKPGTKTN